jgi:pyruvate-formate lyase
MNKAKLKVLLAALKEVVEELESEVYSDTESYTSPAVQDYDEVWDDDDGYPD